MSLTMFLFEFWWLQYLDWSPTHAQILVHDGLRLIISGYERSCFDLYCLDYNLFLLNKNSLIFFITYLEKINIQQLIQQLIDHVFLHDTEIQLSSWSFIRSWAVLSQKEKKILRFYISNVNWFILGTFHQIWNIKMTIYDASINNLIL